ncbi:PTS sugar transporter subunit IIA [Metabacillus arenae]|uniref:PTS sugar transporter subunit IIA n=1 Tax=Metabacillus arenae TaxID=2771434 RepID=A0A926RZM2_9BACI|nr:PTS sugar transporter subunit IIA [Metabacillus arenae]MBD1382955.1 PTS sugar transporter subunit IIA [Metabacillus arenae]
MDLQEVMSTDTIHLSMQVENKQQAIEELTMLLEKKGFISNKEQFIKDIYAREAQGKTGIGDGIAIPHGKSESVIKNAIAIGRVPGEIEWETLDDKPVRVIMLFAVRKADASSVHIKMLAQVAGALADEHVCERLLHSEYPQEIINVFQKEHQS